MTKDKGKYLLKILLGTCAFATLTLILYLYFGDEYMKTCCLLKICIAAIFIICVVLACVLLFSPPCGTNFDVCKCDCKYAFVLVRQNKNETVSIKSNDLKKLLEKAMNGDRLRFFSDDFCIDSEMLSIKIENNKTKELILKYEGNGEFLVLVKR